MTRSSPSCAYSSGVVRGTPERRPVVVNMSTGAIGGPAEITAVGVRVEPLVQRSQQRDPGPGKGPQVAQPLDQSSVAGHRVLLRLVEAVSEGQREPRPAAPGEQPTRGDVPPLRLAPVEDQ